MPSGTKGHTQDPVHLERLEGLREAFLRVQRGDYPQYVKPSHGKSDRKGGSKRARVAAAKAERAQLFAQSNKYEALMALGNLPHPLREQEPPQGSETQEDARSQSTESSVSRAGTVGSFAPPLASISDLRARPPQQIPVCKVARGTPDNLTVELEPVHLCPVCRGRLAWPIFGRCCEQCQGTGGQWHGCWCTSQLKRADMLPASAFLANRLKMFRKRPRRRWATVMDI